MGIEGIDEIEGIEEIGGIVENSLDGLIIMTFACACCSIFSKFQDYFYNKSNIFFLVSE